jgi:hypothetical protein
MIRVIRVFVCGIALCAASFAQQSAPKPIDRWEALQFLLGDWVGKGSGTPGAAAGAYSFHEELNGQILVRRSFADYTAQGGGRHEDLLIVYAATPAERMHAIYFDSEGHVIHYNVATKPNAAIFESDASQPGPRYRLSYTGAADTVSGKFEVAPPGGEFKTYLTWSSVRK